MAGFVVSNLDRIRAYFASCNEGSAAAAHFTEDARIHDLNHAPAVGHETIGRFWEKIVRKWAGATWHLDTVLDDGQRSAIKWTMQGRHNDREFTVRGSEHYEFKDGLIREIHQYWTFTPDDPGLGGRPSIRLARYFPWIEMRAGDLLVRQRQGAGWRSGGASANTATKSVQRRFSAPLGSFDELFGRPVLVAIHGQGCASSKCCASGIATPIRRAPSRPRGRETRASLVPV